MNLLQCEPRFTDGMSFRPIDVAGQTFDTCYIGEAAQVVLPEDAGMVYSSEITREQWDVLKDAEQKIKDAKSRSIAEWLVHAPVGSVSNCVRVIWGQPERELASTEEPLATSEVDVAEYVRQQWS